jgi:hypothetical protein
MKIKRSTNSLQNQLAKMLQAGKENVDNSSDNEKVIEQSNNAPLHANIQTNTQSETEVSVETPVQVPSQVQEQTREEQREPQADPQPEPRQQAPRHSRATTTSRSRAKKTIEETPKLNAAQRHEVPDRNAKYAGEPIKSVGCRMPQSLYARMLQYKALNDSQLNRITLNDIIIEAVDKFLGK